MEQKQMKTEPTTILILGAGAMQEPAIRAAHDLGYRVTVADGNKDAESIPLADTFAPIDLKDRQGIVDLALSIHAKGDLAAVFTAATDFSASVAAATEACGLPGHSVAAAENATDKVTMRSCFERLGVPSPLFFEWDSQRENISHLLDRLANLIFFNVVVENRDNPFAAPKSQMHLPLVVKPVDNMGARGCRMVRTASEIPSALYQAVKVSRRGRVIIESYMDGPEYSVDALVYNNTLTITGFADRHIYFPPYFIEMGHTLPAKVNISDFRALITTFARGVAALGLSHGAVKGDLKMTKTGPMIGEIAGRLSGGYMSGWTFPYATDINLTREALLLALGKTPMQLEQLRTPLMVNPEPSPFFTLYLLGTKRVSAERAWISIPGTVAEVLGTKKAESYAQVRRVIPRIKAGELAVFPRNNVQKGGNVLAVAPRRFRAQACAGKAVAEITLVLAPLDSNTDRFLATERPLDERDFPPDAFGLDEKLQGDIALSPDIEENAQARRALPDWLEAHLDARDWNGLTLAQALKRFDSLRPHHPVLGGRAFWGACIRGSLQGMLYVCDCAAALAKGMGV